MNVFTPCLPLMKLVTKKMKTPKNDIFGINLPLDFEKPSKTPLELL